MSVHVSRGLLPEVPVPICRYHGLAMKLVRADIPIFGRGRTPEKQNWTKRKIYRCRIKGCAWCENGPVEVHYETRQSSMLYIEPWV